MIRNKITKYREYKAYTSDIKTVEQLSSVSIPIICHDRINVTRIKFVQVDTSVSLDDLYIEIENYQEKIKMTHTGTEYVLTTPLILNRDEQIYVNITNVGTSGDANFKILIEGYKEKKDSFNIEDFINPKILEVCDTTIDANSTKQDLSYYVKKDFIIEKFSVEGDSDEKLGFNVYIENKGKYFYYNYFPTSELQRLYARDEEGYKHYSFILLREGDKLRVEFQNERASSKSLNLAFIGREVT
ncbi:MAG: hypothetical protein ACOCV8_01875 [Spirochaetota bacterium]